MAILPASAAKFTAFMAAMPLPAPRSQWAGMVTPEEELEVFTTEGYLQSLRRFIVLHECTWRQLQSIDRLKEFVRVESAGGPWFFAYFYQYIGIIKYAALNQINFDLASHRAAVVARERVVVDGNRRKIIDDRIAAIHAALCATTGRTAWWQKMEAPPRGRTAADRNTIRTLAPYRPVQHDQRGHR